MINLTPGTIVWLKDSNQEMGIHSFLEDGKILCSRNDESVFKLMTFDLSELTTQKPLNK